MPQGVPAVRVGWMPVLLLSALGCLSSCSYIAAGADVCFSPDSSLVAYVCADQWDLPLPPEMPTIRSKVSLRWSRLNQPEDYQAADIGVFGRDWGGWFVVSRIHSAFSPDNRYLAVACPRQLRVLDCQTREQRALTGPGEVVTSLVWLTADRLAYASCFRDGSGERGAACTSFWQQKVDGSDFDRELIFSQQGPHCCPEKRLSVAEWPRERWSPDRRFVLFRAEGFRGDLTLLAWRSEQRESSLPATTIRRDILEIRWVGSGLHRIQPESSYAGLCNRPADWREARFQR